MTSLFDDVGKLILRLALGLLVFMHGYAKLSAGISGLEQMIQGIGLPGFFAYAVFLGEVLGPILLILGLYARVGAALIAINMVAAILLAHSNEFFALTENGGWALELQGMYLFTAVALAFTGPGRLSLNGR